MAFQRPIAKTNLNNGSTCQGKFRYVKKDAVLTPNPDLYHLPPISDFNDLIILPVTDIRSSLSLGDASPYTLSCHGFTARREPSRLHSNPYNRSSWHDQELIKKVYVPEVEALVKRITRCKIAVAEAAVIRNHTYTEVDSHSKEHSGVNFKASDAGPCPRMIGFSSAGGASPAPKVHLDFSPLGARTHIRKYHRNVALAAESVINAENKLLSSGVGWEELKYYYRKNGAHHGGIPRFALFSVWRSLKTVYRDPLAVSSCATFPTSDYVAVDLVQPSGRNIPQELSQIIDSKYLRDSNGIRQPSSLTEDAPTHFSNSYLAHEPESASGHDWHFISNQEPEDVLIIQLFDNEMEAISASKQNAEIGGALAPSVSGVIHSAFELEGQDENTEARESLEIRVVAVW